MTAAQRESVRLVLDRAEVPEDALARKLLRTTNTLGAEHQAKNDGSHLPAGRVALNPELFAIGAGA